MFVRILVSQLEGVYGLEIVVVFSLCACLYKSGKSSLSFFFVNST